MVWKIEKSTRIFASVERFPHLFGRKNPHLFSYSHLTLLLEKWRRVKNTIRHLIGSFFGMTDRLSMQQLLQLPSLPWMLLKTQNLESVFPSCCAVCLVLLASCWALFNFYDSSHSWKQRKIDIQGDYGNVFLTQKMTQFLWLKLSIHYSGSPWLLFPNANQYFGRLEKEWMR